MQQSTSRRLLMVGAFVACLAGGIGFRLYSLQVDQRDRYVARANSQHLKVHEVPATRGAILDRDGGELAVSVQATTLYAHPNKVEDPAGAATALAAVLDDSRAELLEKLSTDKNFTYLGRFLDDETVARVRELDLDSFGPRAFGYLEVSHRQYPRGGLATHVIGNADIDGKGLEGLEGSLDDVLSGEPSVMLIQQDGRNRRVRQPAESQADTASDLPRDVILTIDRVLQHIAERELERAVRETGAKAASAVLLDPRNGEVLALANWPSPHASSRGWADDRARANRAVEHYYEPGSTFKIVPLAAALERGTVRVDQRFDCEQGLWAVENRTIHDVSPHGVLSLHEIVAESSNIGMVKITQTLRPAELRETIEGFGFGDKTGIRLPAESAGSVQPESKWSTFTQTSLSFGQEVGVTVLQMASALGVVANDGVLAPPRVVSGTRAPDSRVEPAPRGEPRRVISSATARTIRAMLEGVIVNGSGHRAAVPGFRLAGKSGTAQKAIVGGYSDDEYMASFGGFGPSHSPRLVGLVVLDSPRGEWIYGGQVAAPVFARIMADALRHLRVPYDTPPAATPAPDLAWRSSIVARDRTLARQATRGLVPAVDGLSAREAIARLVYQGYTVQVRGTGSVVTQTPPAGTRLELGEACTLVLGQPPQRPRRRGDVMEARR